MKYIWDRIAGQFISQWIGLWVEIRYTNIIRLSLFWLFDRWFGESKKTRKDRFFNYTETSASNGLWLERNELFPDTRYWLPFLNRLLLSDLFDLFFDLFLIFVDSIGILCRVEMTGALPSRFMCCPVKHLQQM